MTLTLPDQVALMLVTSLWLVAAAVGKRRLFWREPRRDRKKWWRRPKTS